MMMQIRKEPGFHVNEDGSIVARYGLQSNCAGIVQIQFRVEHTKESGIRFPILEVEYNQASNESEIVSVKDMPSCFRSAVFSGAEEAYIQSSSVSGIDFILIYAFVSTDATELMFKYLGKIAINAWYQSRSNSSKVSWTLRELINACPHLFKSPYDNDEI